MESACYNQILNLIKREVVPALGCTEPISVALASSKAKQILESIPEKIEVYVSANIFKNGMGVGVPGTGMTGLDIAAALGAIGGNHNRGLEVLQDISDEDIELSKKFIKEKKVRVEIKDTKHKLYVEVKCVKGEEYSIVKIIDKHDNICYLEHNRQVLLNNEIKDKKGNEKCKDEEKVNIDVDTIYDFAMNAELEDISFILEGAKMNKKIAEEGLRADYGLKVGKTIMNNIEKGILSDDISTYAMALTSAASDARMAGCMYPVMSNSGSGNQGLTVMLPVVAAAKKLNSSEEQLCRALILSNLIAIHIKTYLGRLSALCGCIVASAGASCGVTYLLGGKLENIKYAIKNMVGNISGMICDGAKTGCALKVSTGVSAAIQSALLAMSNIQITEKEGIIDKDVEKTIRNIANLGANGMNETDKLIIDIMTHK